MSNLTGRGREPKISCANSGVFNHHANRIVGVNFFLSLKSMFSCLESKELSTKEKTAASNKVSTDNKKIPSSDKGRLVCYTATVITYLNLNLHLQDGKYLG